ncbi:MAG TPA: SDR family oxidoreductase [Bacteroidales bacterium]|nr:SDR family oxidoreductase [Bacteroidales bacterium]
MNIVITGASRGIGFSLVNQFVHQGHRVLAVSRNIAPLQDIEAEKHKGLLIPLRLDLEQTASVAELHTTVSRHFEHVDVLVNNAGLLINKPFQVLTDDDFDRLFDVNVKAPFSIIRALESLFAPDSHIVNIGSMGGFQGSAKFSGLSLYSASKGALAILTECLAEELKPRGIKVNCLALGAAQTEMLSEAFPGYHAPVSADEMAAYISWFALNGHRFFNGKILPVSVSTP